MADFELLSVVALVRDLPDERLIRGQVGTIVAVLRPAVFEVEFSNEDGMAYAEVALCAADLMQLHYSRVPKIPCYAESENGQLD